MLLFSFQNVHRRRYLISYVLQPPELDMRDSSSEKCSFAGTLPCENEQVESFEDGWNQSDFFLPPSSVLILRNPDKKLGDGSATGLSFLPHLVVVWLCLHECYLHAA